MKAISVEEMKQIQMDILKDVHRFCTENDLRYTLIFGSLLGAARHKGYIPWDDDMDIAMLRPDYEKFIANYSSKDGHYHVYDHRKDDEYYHPYAKVADTRTILEENTSMKDIGVNIDLFPVDFMFDTKEECENFLDTLSGIKKKFRVKLVKPGKKNVWWKRILIKTAKVAMLPFSMKGLTEKEYQRFARLNYASAKFVAIAVDPEIGPSYKSICKRNIFEKYIKVPFDNEEFMVIAEYDKWLTQMYGDYMTPPDDADRTSPHTLSSIYWI